MIAKTPYKIKFKLSFKRQWKFISSTVYATVVYLLAVLFFYIYVASTDLDVLLYGISYFFAIFIFPTLLLHFLYILENHHHELKINEAEQVIEIIEDRKRYRYHFNDIVDSFEVCSNFVKPSRRNDTKKPFFSKYSYWFVKFNDEKVFAFTCLMLDTSIAHKITNTELKHYLFPVIRNKISSSKIDNSKVTDPNSSDFRNYLTIYKRFSDELLENKLVNVRLSPVQRAVIKHILAQRNTKQ